MRADPLAPLRAVAQWFQLMGFRAGRAEFYEDLAEMYARGEAMLAFLEGELANAVMTRQHSRAAALRIVLRRYTRGSGDGLEGLLRGVAPAGDALMLAGVERAPRRAEALRSLAAAVRLQARMRGLMATYSAAPVAIGAICIALIAVVADVLQSIDRSTPVYVRDIVWRGFNALAKGITDLAVQWGGSVALALAAAGALALWSLPRWTGAWRLRVDGWPVYSLYRDFQAGMLLSALAMLLQAQGTLRGSLEAIATRASPWMRWQLRRVLRSLDEAPNATIQAFGRGLLSPQLLARAATLHRSAPQFADVLVQLGTVEGERVLARVRRTALTMNIALVSLLAAVATLLSLACMTVPAAFAAAMEPATLMAARKSYELRHPRVLSNPPSPDGKHPRREP
jgi:hypothetical protein